MKRRWVGVGIGDYSLLLFFISLDEKKTHRNVVVVLLLVWIHLILITVLVVVVSTLRGIRGPQREVVAEKLHNESAILV